MSEIASSQLAPELLRSLLSEHAKFRSFLANHLPSEAVAEELLQQAYLKVVESEKEKASIENVVAWFYQVLRNLLADYYRANSAAMKKHAKFFEELQSQEATSVPAPDKANDALTKTICTCIDGLILNLKPEYAEVIQRIDLAGEAPAKVAKSLKIETNNLSVRLHRARKALLKNLEQTCGACTEHACLDCNCKKK